MNANETTPTARLNRIKWVSRIVRYAILGMMFFAIGITLLLPLFSSRIWSETPMDKLCFDVLSYIMLCFWYWSLARLFKYYERGLIFASGTIRSIKTLGLLCVISWLLTMTRHFLLPDSLGAIPFPSRPLPPLPPHATVSAPFEVFSASFFTFKVYGVDLGLLLGGIIIVLIAWIMDEGRKIQEQQALTV